MEPKGKRPRYRDMPDGFDVTCVIGRVVFDQGEMNPYEAAFLLIARHDAEGEYRFPIGDQGRSVRVTVAHEEPDGTGEPDATL